MNVGHMSNKRTAVMIIILIMILSCVAILVHQYTLMQAVEVSTQQGATQPATQLGWGPELEGLSLSISADGGVIVDGAPIVVHLQIRNSRADPQFLADSFLGGFSYRVTCHMPDGAKPCSLTHFGVWAQDAIESGAGHGFLTVTRDKNYEMDLPVSRIVDMAIPGKYTIAVTHEFRLSDKRTWRTLESNAIEVEVK
jgi:hypothetical protein